MYENIRAYLGMNHKLVGIKFLHQEEHSKRPPKPLYFCDMVRQASLGKEFVETIDDEACLDAEIILGFREPQYVEIEPRIKGGTKAVRIGPLKDCDVVLFVLTPEQVTILTGLLGKLEVQFRGEQACGDFLARVYNEKKANLSFLCGGARMFGGFRGNELVVGIPQEKVDELSRQVDRILETGGSLCGCKVADIPQQIIKNFEEAGFEKGADYFFGKINGHNVRLYLNKDSAGRLKMVTFYLPIKKPEKEIKVKPPFQMRTRGDWQDIFAVFNPEHYNINLYTGDNLSEVIRKLTKQALGE